MSALLNVPNALWKIALLLTAILFSFQFLQLNLLDN